MDLLEESLCAGQVHPVLGKRLQQSHFSLEDCKQSLAASDLSRVHDIYLLHLSRQNGDREVFRREVVGVTGLPVTIL